MEKELVQLFETVQTCSTVEEERCLDALQKLKVFPVDYDVLVGTQIGKHLRQLTKQPMSEKIQSLASDVVAAWRRVILKGRAKKYQNRCASEIEIMSDSLKRKHFTAITVPESSNSVNRTKVQPCAENDGKKPSTVRVPELRTPEPSAENQDKKNQEPSEFRVPENRTKDQPCAESDGKKPRTVRVPGRLNPVKCKPESSAENQDMKKMQKPSEVRVPEKRRPDQSSAENEDKKKKLQNPIEARSNPVKRKPESSAAENEDRKKMQKVSTVRVPEKKAEDGTQADKNREKIRGLLAEALKKVADETDDASLKSEITSKHDPRGVAEAVESAIFSSWGSFATGDQKHKYRSILYNLKDSKNPDFRRKVLTGEFGPEEIAQLSTEQMASEKRRLETEAIQRKGLNKCENSFKLEATTDAFKCERCNKKETTYSEVQTRSADEPMTVYITCVSCGHKWNTLGA